MKSIGAVLLAAGCSTRMSHGRHKLLVEINGIPLVRRSALTLLDTGLSKIVAVTGHRHEKVSTALSGLPLYIGRNPDYAKGMGTSLAVGFSQPQFADVDGILVMLADMPDLRALDIQKLIRCFEADNGRSVVRACYRRSPGHPVILPRGCFAAVRLLDADRGATNVIRDSGLPVSFCDIGPGALSDIDTTEDAIRAGAVLPCPARRNSR
ncbi:NTP transferase domain-containing protein [Agrobacterium tumefaciens]|uniref:nucleotidyltransferase family protein n=1 Tax=Agrobacterium tumefaciens TaxID=358 RepID=UPI003BB8FF0B